MNTINATDDMLSTDELINHVNLIFDPSNDDIEELELRWKVWLENEYASDLPESIYEDLWDRCINWHKGIDKEGKWLIATEGEVEQPKIDKYPDLEYCYSKDVAFAHEAIETAKDLNYGTAPGNTREHSYLRKEYEKYYTSNIPVRLLDYLWNETYRSSTEGLMGQHQRIYRANVNFAHKSIEAAKRTGYLPS